MKMTAIVKQALFLIVPMVVLIAWGDARSYAGVDSIRPFPTECSIPDTTDANANASAVLRCLRSSGPLANFHPRRARRAVTTVSYSQAVMLAQGNKELGKLGSLDDSRAPLPAEYAVSNCKPSEKDYETGLIRRMWTNKTTVESDGYHRVEAELELPASPFGTAFGALPRGTIGYVYISGRGSNCSNFEAGFQYSSAHQWWNPYMRLDANFSYAPTRKSKDGEILGMIRCNIAKPFCLDEGLGKGAGSFKLSVDVLRVKVSCGCSTPYRIAIAFQTYPSYAKPEDGIAIVVLGPRSANANNTWNGWGIPCRCQFLRETNVAQSKLDWRTSVKFGPISWKDVRLNNHGWAAQDTLGCQTYDGLRRLYPECKSIPWRQTAASIDWQGFDSETITIASWGAKP